MHRERLPVTFIGDFMQGDGGKDGSRFPSHRIEVGKLRSLIVRCHMAVGLNVEEVAGQSVRSQTGRERVASLSLGLPRSFADDEG